MGKSCTQETPNRGTGSDPGANQRPFHQESGNSIEKVPLLAQRKVWKLDSYALVKGWRRGYFNTCDGLVLWMTFVTVNGILSFNFRRSKEQSDSFYSAAPYMVGRANSI